LDDQPVQRALFRSACRNCLTDYKFTDKKRVKEEQKKGGGSFHIFLIAIFLGSNPDERLSRDKQRCAICFKDFIAAHWTYIEESD
jgi:hypothetical protein